MPRPISQLDRPKLVALLTAIAMAKADLSHQASLFGVDPETLWNLPRAEQAVERAIYSLDTQEPETDRLAREEARRAAQRAQREAVRREDETAIFYESLIPEDEARTMGLRSGHTVTVEVD